MSTEYNLHQLLSAIQVLKDLPVMKLAENKTLVREIQSVISGRNINGIIESMQRDYRLEQDAAFNTPKNSSSIGMDSPEFHHLYAKYRGAAHNVLSEKAGKSFTQPISMSGAVAFNALSENPMFSKSILELPEAKRFKEAFNSIYSDHALQIRTANDPTTISSFIDYSPYIWNYIYYLSIPTLAQTIDLSIQIATRQPPRIEMEDKELKKQIETVLKRTRFTEKLQKMLLYSHLSPRGSLIVPIQDDDGTIRFNIFNDTQFTYATSYQYSRIDFRENMTGVSSLYVLGHLLQNEVTAHFLCPGFEPIYAIGKNRLYQLKDAAEAVNIYLYTIKVLAIRAQVMVQSWGGEGQNDTLLRMMQNQTDDINSKLSLNTAVKLPQDAKLDILNSNFTPGFAEVSTIVKEYQGMLSGIMADYFYGSDTAYAANTFNIHATHQNIRSQVQEAQVEPIYRFVINKYLEMDSRFEKWRKYRDEFDIYFESLYEPTETEKIENDAKKINNIVTMAGYPELQRIFKESDVMNDEWEFPEIERPSAFPAAEEEESSGSEAKNSTFIQTIDPKKIMPLHEVRYEPKLMRLMKRMEEFGWQGDPLIVIDRAANMTQGITGTHRIQAAQAVGIEMPVVKIPSTEITEKLTTGKDEHRLKIIESQEFADSVGHVELIDLCRRIMRAEVKKNGDGW